MWALCHRFLLARCPSLSLSRACAARVWFRRAQLHFRDRPQPPWSLDEPQAAWRPGDDVVAEFEGLGDVRFTMRA